MAADGRMVSTEAEVRSAWGPTGDGRVRLVLVRDGTEETIDTPLPETVVCEVPAER